MGDYFLDYCRSWKSQIQTMNNFEERPNRHDNLKDAPLNGVIRHIAKHDQEHVGDILSNAEILLLLSLNQNLLIYDHS